MRALCASIALAAFYGDEMKRTHCEHYRNDDCCFWVDQKYGRCQLYFLGGCLFPSLYAPAMHRQNTAADFADIFSYHHKGLHDLWVSGPRNSYRTLEELHTAYLDLITRLRDDVERDLGLSLPMPPEPIIEAYKEATRMLSRYCQDCADKCRNFDPRLMSLPNAEKICTRKESTLRRMVKSGDLTNFHPEGRPIKVSYHQLKAKKLLLK